MLNYNDWITEVVLHSGASKHRADLECPSSEAKGKEY